MDNSIRVNFPPVSLKVRTDYVLSVGAVFALICELEVHLKAGSFRYSAKPIVSVFCFLFVM